METSRRDKVRGNLMQAMPKGAVAAEVGVWEGAFKPNGIIAGGDFNWQAQQSGAPVKAAVEGIVAALGSRASLRLMANQYIITLARG